MYADDILKKQKSDSSLTDEWRGTLTGATIGLIGGALFAYFRKQPYIKSMMIGSVAGGVISRIFITYKK